VEQPRARSRSVPSLVAAARLRDRRLPAVEGGKGYHLELDPGEPATKIPIAFVESRVAATPLPVRLRLAGTLELAGLDLSVSQRRVDAVLTAGRRGLPSLATRPVKRIWRGLRPCTPDGLPIVGPPGSIPNLVFATGHAMMGITLAPVTGQIVREIVTGQPPSFDLAALSPDRFRKLLPI
jgi:D-amino-acid dehydrogenase